MAAKARGKLAHRIFNTYNLGDTAIIQGNISIKSKKVELLEISKNLKMKKFINIKINKIYNVKKDL